MNACGIFSMPLGAIEFDSVALVYVLAHSLWQAPLWGGRALDGAAAGLAHPADRQQSSGERYLYEAEGKTDEEGGFRMSTLPDRRVRLGARPMTGLSGVVVRPGDEASAPEVALRGKVPEWHRRASQR